MRHKSGGVQLYNGEFSQSGLQTICPLNRFTQLDAFPLPRISDTVNEIAQYEVFSTLDLQIPLKEDEKPYTAFEAKGGLDQFTRLPFGVTNGVACFQREMMKFVEDNHLKAVLTILAIHRQHNHWWKRPR